MRNLFLVACALLTFTVAAHADPFVPFALSGILADGGTATGSLSINTTSGYLNTNNIVVKDKGFTYTFIGSFIDLEYFNGTSYEQYSVSYDSAGDSLLLVFPQALLIGYAGGSLCSLSAPCPGTFISSFQAANSQPVAFTSLTASATPEPGTLGLVGLSLPGILYGVRRKIERGLQAPDH